MAMRYLVPAIACLVTLFVAPARAQTLGTGDTVCVSIDESRDTLSPPERIAAVLVLGREFERAGHPVVSDTCTTRFALSHIRLGENILVALEGPVRRLEGRALGLEDLPLLYNQMVRSFVTGKPMSGFNVTDRTNVTAAQESSPHRVQVDSFGYARLGYGGIFGGDRAYGSPSFGLGYRAEMDAFGLDVSFLNFAIARSSDYYGATPAMTGEWLRLEGLYFLKPTANATAYVGGGISYGGVSFTSSASPTQYRGVTYMDAEHFDGSGLMGVLTAGYEVPRASAMRVFIQADVVIPFFAATATRVANPGLNTTTESRRGSSAMVSVGLGWHGRHGARQ